MTFYGKCGRCQGRVAVLDVLTEGYDLICTRCGEREVRTYKLKEPPPCFQ